MKKKTKKKELSIGYLLGILAILVTATIGTEMYRQDIVRDSRKAFVEEEDNSDIFRDGMVYDEEDDFEIYVSEEALAGKDLEYYSLNKVTAKTLKTYLKEVSEENGVELNILLNDFRYVDTIKNSILEYDRVANYVSENHSKEFFLKIYDGDIEEDVDDTTIIIVRALLENSARSYYREVTNFIEKGNVETLATSLANSSRFLNIVSSFDDVKLLETLRGFLGEEV